MNTEVDNLTMDEALDKIESFIIKKIPTYVVTPNVDHIVQLEKDKTLQDVYKNADLILADGKPLIWISQWYGKPIKEKVSGSDLFPRLCEKAAIKGWSIYLLGASEGVAIKAAENLRKKNPNLKISGVYSPPFGFENNKSELQKIKAKIQNAHPDILVVGLGCPKQEKYIYFNYKELNVPISLGLGASIDFEAGKVKRAPKWMCNHGLEWAFRITQDPKRMLKRYFFNDLKIMKLIWKYR